MDKIINAEARGKEIFIKISHPSKQMLAISSMTNDYRFAFNFWDCVAKTWNRDYGSYMSLRRINRAESGVCNEDESIQFRPINTGSLISNKTDTIKFRNGRLSILNLQRFAKCISKSIKELTHMNDWEVKFNRKYLNRIYEYNIDQEQIMDAENRFEDIIIKVSHPTEKNLGIYNEQTGNSFAIDFWDSVAETWNKVYASIMIMKRISCSESGICNLEESVQFRPTGGNYIKFRNGKLSFRDLRRMTTCILQSIKKLKRMKNLKVELKFITHCSESEDCP